jgi:hypothetical protein
MDRKVIVIVVLFGVITIAGIYYIPKLMSPSKLNIQNWNSGSYIVNRQVHIPSEKEDILYFVKSQIMITNTGKGDATNIKVYFEIVSGPVNGNRQYVQTIDNIPGSGSNTCSCQFDSGWIPSDSEKPSYKVNVKVTYNNGENNLTLNFR